MLCVYVRCTYLYVSMLLRMAVTKVLDSTVYSVYMAVLIVLNVLLVLLVFLSSQKYIPEGLYSYQFKEGTGRAWNMLELIFILGYIVDSSLRIYAVTARRFCASVMVLLELLCTIIACVLFFFPEVVVLRFVLVVRLCRVGSLCYTKIKERGLKSGGPIVTSRNRLGTLNLTTTADLLQPSNYIMDTREEKMLKWFDFNYETKWLMKAKLAQLRLFKLLIYKAQEEQLTDLLSSFKSEHISGASEFYQFQDTEYDFATMLSEKGKFHRVLADMMLCKFKPLMQMATSM